MGTETENQPWQEQVDTALAHYGVKGMRWGFRKSEHEGGTTAKRAKVPDSISPDKQAANAAAARITQKGDTSALSNKELQQVVQRMNLEQQYSRLADSPGKLKSGSKKAKEIVDAVNTGKTVYSMTPTPVKTKIGKALRGALISTAVLAGKAYYRNK